MLKFDTSKIVPVILSVVPSASKLRETATTLGAAAQSEWYRLAKSELRSSTKDYIDGIQDPVLKRGGKVVEISLEGPLPNMIEHGWPGGDQRAFLAHMGAKNAKLSKEGFYYNHIPFRHGSPGTGGRNVGKPMNKRVYEVVKNFGAKDRLDHKKMVDPAVAKIIRTKVHRWNSTGRYQGMVQRGGYMTFRTVSEKNPKGWIHPGIRARRLAPKVMNFIAETANALIEDSLKK